jgi:hypothetical protein
MIVKTFFGMDLKTSAKTCLWVHLTENVFIFIAICLLSNNIEFKTNEIGKRFKTLMFNFISFQFNIFVDIHAAFLLSRGVFSAIAIFVATYGLTIVSNESVLIEKK